MYSRYRQNSAKFVISKEMVSTEHNLNHTWSVIQHTGDRIFGNDHNLNHS